MAGVSVQAFRRQGRRFGAGLVCSEMVSCAGLHHGNERTLGYLRIASDEHPLAVQIFGSEPTLMAEAARMVVDAGADIVDINFGCPVRKVTKTGAGATLLDDPDARVADRRRGRRRGRRARLREDAPRRSRTARARAWSSARDWSTPARQRSRCILAPPGRCTPASPTTRSPPSWSSCVDVPVIACGDVTSRAKAQSVLATTGAAAVMVGRGAQGNPWVLREILGEDAAEPTREEVVAELILFVRETVRELGERRASGFLKKFYGWYLGRGRFPRPFKQELVVLDSTDEVIERLFAAAPGAAEVLERLEAEQPVVDDALLDLPDLHLRRRLGVPAASLPLGPARGAGRSRRRVCS